MLMFLDHAAAIAGTADDCSLSAPRSTICCFGNDATGGQDKLVKQIFEGNDAYRL
jgi:hypothetical protein